MDPREQARALLEEARDILAARLVELVLGDAESLLDDARGDSYMGEIDSLYEQVGLRLVHVNQMLAQLPPSSAPAETLQEETAPSSATSSSAAPRVAPIALPLQLKQHEEPPRPIGSRPIILPQVLAPRLALPQPQSAPVRSASSDLLLSLTSLAAEIHAGDFAAATERARELFHLELSAALDCVRLYARRQALDPDFVAGSMLLAPAIEAGRLDDALPLLGYCFGFEPAAAIAVYHRLRQQSSGAR